MGTHRFSTICMITVDTMNLNDMPVNFLPNQGPEHSREGRPNGKYEDRAYKDKSYVS